MSVRSQLKEQASGEGVGRSQLLNLILAWGYVVRIACREKHESMPTRLA